MSQVLEKQPSQESTEAVSSHSPAELLTPKLQDEWALEGKHLLIVAAFVLWPVRRGRGSCDTGPGCGSR